MTTNASKARPLELSVGQRIVVQRDSAGIFPASASTALKRRLTAEITEPPERFDPSMGKRKRWSIETDLGRFTVADHQNLLVVER